MQDVLRIKRVYKKDDVIACGRVITGDQVIVNKMAYNFVAPKEGMYQYLIHETLNMTKCVKIRFILNAWLVCQMSK